MKDNFKHSDSHASQKLSGLNMTPPPGAWDAISKEIKPRRRAGLIWTIIIAALFAIGTTAVLIVSSNTDTKNEKNAIAQNGGSEQSSNQNQSRNDQLNSNDAKNNNTNKSTDGNNSFTVLDGTIDGSSNSESSKSGVKSSDSASSSDKSSDSKSTSGDSKTKTGDKKGSGSDKGVDSKGDAASADSKTASGDKKGDSKSSDSKTGKGDDKSIASSSGDKTAAKETAMEIDPYLTTPNELLPTRPYSPFTWITSNDRNNWFQITPGKRSLSRFSLEAGLGINTYRINPLNATDNSLSLHLKEVNTRELGYSIFTKINYRITPRWSAYTGFEYASQKHMVDLSSSQDLSYWMYDSIGSYFDTTQQQQVTIYDTTYVDSIVTSSLSSENKATFITIPFGFTHHFGINTRSSLALSIGGAYRFAISNTGLAATDASGGSLETLSAYRQKNILTARLALRYSYVLNPRLNLYAEPWIGFGLNNYSQDALLYKTRLNTMGLRVGLRFDL